MLPFTGSRVLVLVDNGSNVCYVTLICAALQPPQMSGRYGYLTLFRRTLSFKCSVKANQFNL